MSVTEGAEFEACRAHVIAALDVDEMERALEIVEELDGVVERFKIGSKLFTRYGPAILDALGERGCKVFLDLKYHDIPSVVGQACEQAARHESVFLMTVHAVGGAKMLAQAASGARGVRGDVDVIAVTALTSHAPGELGEVGVSMELEAWARALGQVAMGAGVSGLVCSAHEASALREAHPEAILVTPGIRPASWTRSDDQTRVMTPKQALDAGSSFLVIGRPIYKAEDARAAAIEIARELEAR